MTTRKIKLNLGCGDHAPSGWINVDNAWGARFARIPPFRTINRRLHLFRTEWPSGIFIHNLCHAFPWKTESVDIIYSSHTLEHLTKEEGAYFLQECHRVLKHKGILRVVVPNLTPTMEAYAHGALAADDLMKHLGADDTKSDDSRLRKWLSPFFSRAHKCMYDAKRLTEILQEIGFDAVPMTYRDSAIDDIDTMETKALRSDSLVVEGSKR